MDHLSGCRGGRRADQRPRDPTLARAAGSQSGGPSILFLHFNRPSPPHHLPGWIGWDSAGGGGGQQQTRVARDVVGRSWAPLSHRLSHRHPGRPPCPFPHRVSFAKVRTQVVVVFLGPPPSHPSHPPAASPPPTRASQPRLPPTAADAPNSLFMVATSGRDGPSRWRDARVGSGAHDPPG